MKFNVQIKKIEAKQLVDGSLSGRVTLEGSFPSGIIASLNELQGTEKNKSFEIEVEIH